MNCTRFSMAPSCRMARKRSNTLVAGAGAGGGEGTTDVGFFWALLSLFAWLYFTCSSKGRVARGGASSSSKKQGQGQGAWSRILHPRGPRGPHRTWHTRGSSEKCECPPSPLLRSPFPPPPPHLCSPCGATSFRWSPTSLIRSTAISTPSALGFSSIRISISRASTSCATPLGGGGNNSQCSCYQSLLPPTPSPPPHRNPTTCSCLCPCCPPPPPRPPSPPAPSPRRRPRQFGV